jgi:hypothetical protein
VDTFTVSEAIAQAKAAKQCADILATATDASDDHLYLKNHHVPAIGLKVDKHGNLLIPVLNADYQIQSLQSISLSGFKKFYEGAAAKGGFFLLGSVVDGVPIRIAEGYAKACLSYILTGQAVFIAFSKGNLDHVALMVRNQYPDHEIILNADNDHLDKQGNPRTDNKNGGLIAANQAANLINGFVCVPYCNTGTDFNDVFAELGQEETLKQLSVFIKPSAANAEFLPLENKQPESEISVISDNTESVTNTLACLLSYVPSLEKSVINAIKDKSKHCKTCHKAFTPKREHHTQCPRCFIAETKQTKPQYNWIDHTQHDVSYVNQRYLNVPPTEGKVNIYISTQGTGKTYGAVNFVKSLPAMSVLYIAHLVTLVFQAARKFGIECYSDHKKINEHERLAVCINSIFKLIDAMGNFLIYDTVVLDEIEQQLTRMIGTGKDAIKNKPLVFSVLCHLIRNAKTLVCLDADISPITLNLVQRLRPNERFNVIINEWQDTEITHHIYENETDVINLTRAAIAKIEPALLMTNGLNKSIELDNLIECDNKIVINSKTSKLAAVKEFVNNVNEQSKKYLLGIFSPTVNTGFSTQFNEIILSI